MPIAIHELIRSNAVTIHFQPVISIKKHSIIGVEALSRGNDGPYRLLTPSEIFSWAQEAELLDELDTLCKKNALLEFAKLPNKPEGLLLFINLHAGRLRKGQLSSLQVRHDVEAVGLRPQDVVLELNNREADVPGLRSFIDTCQSFGFTVALDDIDGSSESLRHLQTLKPNLAKADPALIHGIGLDPVKQAQLRSITTVARHVGAMCIAEGVESDEEAALCLELGVDLMQGFHFGRPAPSNAYPFHVMQSSVDRSAGRYKATLAGKAHGRVRENKKHLDLLDKMEAALTDKETTAFEGALMGFVNSMASVECLWVMSAAGEQVTPTVAWKHQRDEDRSLLFAPARPGADHSLKDYYLGLNLESGARRYMSEPYISLATGNLCRTVAARFTAADTAEYILCMDIKTQ